MTFRYIGIFAVAIALASCAPQESKTVTIGGDAKDGEVLKTDTIMKAMPSGKTFMDPKHGKELWFAVGPVEGKPGTPVNGFLQAHAFEDGVFALDVQMNAYPAGEGRYYSVWLAKDGVDWVPAGTPRSHFGDARHQLKFETDQDLRSFARVVVTLESDDGNPEPDLVVAEGTLTVRER